MQVTIISPFCSHINRKIWEFFYTAVLSRFRSSSLIKVKTKRTSENYYPVPKISKIPYVSCKRRLIDIFKCNLHTLLLLEVIFTHGNDLKVAKSNSEGIFLFPSHLQNHQRRKYGGSSPNSLRPISYFGSIWELYVLDPKTKIFCRKKIQLHFSMNKGLTVPKKCQ